MKKQNFIQAASIVAIAQLLVKIIGALYKIPLDRFILGTEGMGIFSASYTIFNWLLVVSTVGLPVAISKIVAERSEKSYESYKIFLISRRFLFVIGITGFLIMLLGAGFFSELISAPSAKNAIAAISPSVLFVSLNSAYRGYYQGRRNMIPTAFSEVIEALIKLILGIILAYNFKILYNSVSAAATGAVLGVMTGTVISFLFLEVYHLKEIKRERPIRQPNEKIASWTNILIDIIKTAVPITLGASVFTMSSLIDTALVMNRLSTLGFVENQRVSLYGYLNRAITMFNMPLTIISAITVSVVPSISHELSVRNTDMAKEYIQKTLKIAIFAALPCAVGLAVLSDNIFLFIYDDAANSSLLVLMGTAVLFAVLSQVTSSILQAYGKVWLPVIHMVIGAIVKIFVSYNMVANPALNINGAPIGTLCCYITVMILNIIRIIKIADVRLSLKDFIIKPLITGAAAFAAAYMSKMFCSRMHNIIQIGITVIVTAAVYFAVLFLTKSVTLKDIKELRR